MSRTLIVGCGYLGTRIAEHLLQHNHRVIGTTRSPEQAAKLERLGVASRLLDISDIHMAVNLPIVEQVVLCVGYDRRSGLTRRDVGVTALSRILKRLLKTQLRQVVYTGSISVYGQTNGEWVDESSPTEPATEPGRVQVEAEAALTHLFPKLLILRLAGIYGPSRIIHREALMRGDPLPGDPMRWLNLIHVDDAARAVSTALQTEHPPTGVINVCDDRPVTRAEYASQAARVLGCGEPRWSDDEPSKEANRRVRNARLKASLLPELEYPTITEGLPQAAGAGRP